MTFPTSTCRPRGQRKTQDPCQGCFLHRDRCICSQIVSLDLATRVTVLIHSKETKRTTNTGLLAAKALINSQVTVHGRRDQATSVELPPGYQHWVLAPGAKSQELTTELFSKPGLPVHLIVPDGNWRQASKMPDRIPELIHLPRLKLVGLNTDRSFLRKESKPEGLATLQSIALALGFIEGAKVQRHLLELYDLKLQATLRGRGQ